MDINVSIGHRAQVTTTKEHSIVWLSNDRGTFRIVLTADNMILTEHHGAPETSVAPEAESRTELFALQAYRATNQNTLPMVDRPDFLEGGLEALRALDEATSSIEDAVSHLTMAYGSEDRGWDSEVDLIMTQRAKSLRDHGLVEHFDATVSNLIRTIKETKLQLRWKLQKMRRVQE